MLMYHSNSSLLVVYGPRAPRNDQSEVLEWCNLYPSSVYPYLPCDLVGFPFVILER